MGFIASCEDIMSEIFYGKYFGREQAYDVDVTQLVQPEVVRSASRVHEVTLRKLLVDLLCGEVKLVQDPLLDQTLVSSRLSCRRRQP